MRKGGGITAAILDVMKKAVKTGISTGELDEIARREIKKYSVESSFEGYRPAPRSRPFPRVVCVSINDEIVHAVPGERVLEESDIVSLDFSVKHRGLHTDAALKLPVGKVSKKAEELIAVTEEALRIGIMAAKAGAYLGDVGRAIQKYVEERGFGIVRDLAGHGIGKNLHEEPLVLNYGNPGEGTELKEGMTIAIEPMITEGDFRIKQGNDGFVFKTIDGKLSAHFEHTVLITKSGGEVLTKL